MIQANELRIGNLVTDQFGEICTVDSIHQEEIFNAELGEIPINCVLPIKLTEQWLLRFGFDKTSLHYFKKNGIIIQQENDQSFECFLGSIIAKVQHVHQLQNLYFALTGEELTLQT